MYMILKETDAVVAMRAVLLIVMMVIVMIYTSCVVVPNGKCALFQKIHADSAGMRS